MATKKLKFVPRFKSLRALFRAKSRWVTGYYAVNAKGQRCGPHNKSAVAFCLMGGLKYCYPTGAERHAAKERMQEVLHKKKLPIDIPIYNDDSHRTIEEIRAFVKEARV